MERGYVQIYTGDGKGKTTAALGLAMRAIGAGIRVFIAQFAKGRGSSEQRAFSRLGEQVVFQQFGTSGLIRGPARLKDRQLANAALHQTRVAMRNGDYGMVILDEANVAVMLGIVDLDDLLELINEKPNHVELVITGRAAHPRLIERADLVTEMREVKHYYRQGIAARVGIEV